MSSLREVQADFASAVLEPKRAIPSALRCSGEPSGAERFSIYRNNVMVALAEALRDAYPVVCRLVGDEFFSAMAATFARSHPPRSPVMLDYGAGFSEFIAGFPPAASVPYLADVAALERGWVEAYHAPDRAEAGDHPFTLHPAARLVRSNFPILAIWLANLGDELPEAIELGESGDNVLVTRPDAEVRAYRVTDEVASTFDAIASGQENPGSRTSLDDLCALGALLAPR